MMGNVIGIEEVGRYVRRVRQFGSELGRRPLRVSHASARTPTLYFLAPDFRAPSGGTRLIYRHVDILNDLGIPAVALHQRPGFRYAWFANQTRVSDVRSVVLHANDVVVVPETDVALIAAQPGIPHIVLNQSGHLTWQKKPDLVVRHYRRSPDLIGAIVVSDHSAELLAYALPELKIARVRGSIDPLVFHPAEAAVPRIISYTPRRGAADIDLVIAMMRSRDNFRGWAFRALDGLAQEQFAQRLRTSRIMLNLSYQEGFGLPAAEAMMSGNYVIGYHGFGGREFFKPEFSRPVATGDVLGVVRALEDAIRRDSESPGWCRERGRAAARFMASEYSPERERSDVQRAYGELLSTERAR